MGGGGEGEREREGRKEGVRKAWIVSGMESNWEEGI